MGSLHGSDMVVLGAFAPALRTSSWLTIELAGTELAAAGGMPTAPVVVVSCDPERAGDAMRHLVDELGARAIVASMPEAELRAAAAVAPSDALLISPNGPGALPPPEVWYLGAPQASAVPGFDALIHAAAEARPEGAGPLKVASVRSDAIEDQAIAELLRAAIELDGRDVAYLEREGRWAEFSVSGSSLADNGDVLDAIVEYGPDLVVWFAGGEFAGAAEVSRSALIERLEQRLSRPSRYVFGPRNVTDAALRSLAGRSASFRARSALVRVHRATEPAAVAALNQRFGERFPGVDTLQTGLGADPDVYDAVYYAAYAASAALNGNGLAPGEGLLDISYPGGPRVDIGPGAEGLQLAIESLQQHVPFNLHGTSGPAEFEREGHARPAEPRLLCWDDGGQLVEAAVFGASLATPTLSGAPCAEELLGASAD